MRLCHRMHPTILNKYGQVKGLEDYLKQYAQDIIDNVGELILEQEEDDFAPAMFNRVPARYQANVIAPNKPNSGAPVIFEDFNALQLAGSCRTTHPQRHNYYRFHSYSSRCPTSSQWWFFNAGG